MGRLNTRNMEPSPFSALGFLSYLCHGDEQSAAQGLPFTALRSGLKTPHLRAAANPRVLHSLQSISMLCTLLVL